jgi:tRNA U34 5-methylaminomethyl-2-thiouridine-forming methyltransferase MnmC
MPLKLIVTNDGSHTIEGAGGITYHSTFGAIQESRHIFIDAGLRALAGEDKAEAQTGQAPVRIFEMGLGTGLNALLTMLEAAGTGRRIVYETAETKPLPLPMVRELNYCRLLGRPDWQPLFEQLHTSPWETGIDIHPNFTFYKTRTDGASYALQQSVGLVYYDAFDPVVQPELWTPEVFEKLYARLTPGALLVTYCCKGAVQRALRSAGFALEKLPGPPGKREIIRAKKPGDAAGAASTH